MLDAALAAPAAPAFPPSGRRSARDRRLSSGGTCARISMRDRDKRSSMSRVMRCAWPRMMSRKRSRAAASLRAGPCSVSMKPSSEASGVRSSWLALATKSARMLSSRRAEVRSRKNRTTPAVRPRRRRLRRKGADLHLEGPLGRHAFGVFDLERFARAQAPPRCRRGRRGCAARRTAGARSLRPGRSARAAAFASMTSDAPVDQDDRVRNIGQHRIGDAAAGPLRLDPAPRIAAAGSRLRRRDEADRAAQARLGASSQASHGHRASADGEQHALGRQAAATGGGSTCAAAAKCARPLRLRKRNRSAARVEASHPASSALDLDAPRPA